MQIGIAHHLGWAVAVVTDDRFDVIERRRIELIEDGLPGAPIHHEGGPHEMHRSGPPLSDGELAELVARVRASVVRVSGRSLDEMVASCTGRVTSLSVRSWPADFPTDIATLRRVPHESRADSVMYCQVLADLAVQRGWSVHRYDAKTVERDAETALGERAHEVLHGPRSTLGPPWSKDHRTALAATVLATGPRHAYE